MLASPVAKRRAFTTALRSTSAWSGVNLTNMWKATGKAHHKKPAYWLKNAGTQELIEVLQKLEKTRKSGFLETKKGRNGWTFAHWQLAVAYAAFLAPHFQLWIGNLVRERFEEAANPELGLERAEIRARSRGWWRLSDDCRPRSLFTDSKNSKNPIPRA